MKKIEGIVISLPKNKTVIVKVTRKSPHPLYGRIVTKNKKYKADCGDKLLSVGDTVMLAETRPLSKEKNFKVLGKMGDIPLRFQNTNV